MDGDFHFFYACVHSRKSQVFYASRRILGASPGFVKTCNQQSLVVMIKFKIKYCNYSDMYIYVRVVVHGFEASVEE